MICDQFDVLYKEGAKSGRVMAIALHPYLIGVPHRIGAFDAALKYICKHKKVWKATGSEIARHYLAQLKGGAAGKTKLGQEQRAQREDGDEDASHGAAAALLLCRGPADWRPPARAADTVTIGTVGSASAEPSGRSIIGLKKGFYAAENLKRRPRLRAVERAIWCSSSPRARSTSRMSTGLVDPIHAIDKGAPISIVRLEMQAPPYALMAKPAIKKLKDLKGKIISLGGPKDITRIYVERMLAPHGVKPGEFDMVFAGATSARASGAAGGRDRRRDPAAAVQLPGRGRGLQQSRPDRRLRARTCRSPARWSTATGRPRTADVLQRILAAHNKSVAWFYDPKNRARGGRRSWSRRASIKPEDIEKTYDFFCKRHVLRAHRHGLADQDERAADGAAGARRSAEARPTSSASCCRA